MTRYEKAVELVKLVAGDERAVELVKDLLARDLAKTESETARVLVEVKNSLPELLAVPATAKELAEKAGLTKGKMVYILGVLYDEGLVAREKESDRSAYTYKLV